MIASNAQCFFHPRRWSCCTFISFSSWLFLPFLSLSLAMLYILKLVVCKDQLISNCTNNRTTQDWSQDTAVTPRRRTTKRQEGWWWHRTLLCFKEVRGWITILHEAMDQTQSPEARRYISFLVFEHKWMNQRRRTEDNDITWHKERKKVNLISCSFHSECDEEHTRKRRLTLQSSTNTNANPLLKSPFILLTLLYPKHLSWTAKRVKPNKKCSLHARIHQHFMGQRDKEGQVLRHYSVEGKRWSVVYMPWRTTGGTSKCDHHKREHIHFGFKIQSLFFNWCNTVNNRFSWWYSLFGHDKPFPCHLLLSSFFLSCPVSPFQVVCSSIYHFARSVAFWGYNDIIISKPESPVLW